MKAECLLSASLLLCGCQAVIRGDQATATPSEARPNGDAPVGAAGAGPRPAAATCTTTPAPGPSPLRRLTHREYDNTSLELLGIEPHPSAAFSPEDTALGFDNNAMARGTTTLLAEQYLAAAEALAARAVEHVSELTGCDESDACGRAFIERIGAKAYRRPLNDADRTLLSGLFASAKSQWGFGKAIELVLAAILQSPHYLYRVEVGVPTATPGVRALGPYELAARLSYLLRASAPDPVLLSAAASGKLSSRGQVAAHARRLMQDQSAHAVLADFHRQWLGLDLVDGITSSLPGFGPELRPLLHQETAALVDATLWQGDGKLATLLTAPFSFMNATLARFYGVVGPSGDAFEKVMLDPEQRLGILTQGGILAAHSHAAKTSPVLRGKFVREALLCNPPPPPPGNVDFTVAEKDSSLSVREQSSQHRADPGCAGCHQFMDPIGLAFEGFDAAGRYRSQENGVSVDTSGELSQSDVDGPVTGPSQLVEKLAHSQQVQSCLVRQWFRYAYARDEQSELDACSVRQLEAGFATTGGSIPELVVALTQTDAFMYRSVGEGESL